MLMAIPAGLSVGRFGCRQESRAANRGCGEVRLTRIFLFTQDQVPTFRYRRCHFRASAH